MEYSSGVMGKFAGKPGSAGRGAKICPACHRPIYAGEWFARPLESESYYHRLCLTAN